MAAESSTQNPRFLVQAEITKLVATTAQSSVVAQQPHLDLVRKIKQIIMAKQGIAMILMDIFGPTFVYEQHEDEENLRRWGNSHYKSDPTLSDLQVPLGDLWGEGGLQQYRLLHSVKFPALCGPDIIFPESGNAEDFVAMALAWHFLDFTSTNLRGVVGRDYYAEIAAIYLKASFDLDLDKTRPISVLIECVAKLTDSLNRPREAQTILKEAMHRGCAGPKIAYWDAYIQYKLGKLQVATDKNQALVCYQEAMHKYEAEPIKGRFEARLQKGILLYDIAKLKESMPGSEAEEILHFYKEALEVLNAVTDPSKEGGYRDQGSMLEVSAHLIKKELERKLKLLEEKKARESSNTGTATSSPAVATCPPVIISDTSMDPTEAIIGTRLSLFEKQLVRVGAIRLSEQMYGYGVKLSKAGFPKIALVCFKAAFDLNPKNTLALINHGHVLKSLGRFLEAQRSYEQATIVEPVYSGIVCEMAMSRKVGELKEAAAPEQALTYYKDRIKHYEAVIIQDEVVLKKAGEYSFALFNQGLMLAHVARLQEAVGVPKDEIIAIYTQVQDTFQKILDMDQNNADACGYFCIAQSKLRRLKKFSDMFAATVTSTSEVKATPLPVNAAQLVITAHGPQFAGMPTTAATSTTSPPITSPFKK